MSRLFAICIAFAALAACSVSLDGPCKDDTQCISPATCVKNLCQLPCFPKCGPGQVCQNATCIQQGPIVKSVAIAPTTWLPRSAGTNFTVTAVIDDGQGPGTASAALHIAGQQDIAGTTTGTGAVRTYSFSVPTTVQTAGSETPVAFTVDAIDSGGHPTLSNAIGTGQLLIDDKGPTLPNVVTVNGGVVGTGGIKWFPSAGANIDVQVAIADAGSGVSASTLTLMQGSTRLDTAAPPLCTGSPAALLCHFYVPESIVTTGNQSVINFAVSGTDVAGNPIQTNTAALGIDAKPPTITFTVGTSGTTTLYPAAGTNCNNGLADTSLFCGHDGSHFYRAGETNALTFNAVDTGGSGVMPSASTYSIAGSTNCTPASKCATTNAGGGNFTFVPDFSSATFVTGADGSGTVSVTVYAQDAVGNASSTTVTGINVTRTKWARKLANISGLAGSAVVTPVIGNDRQIILAGAGGANDSIVSLNSTGAIVGTLGASQVTAITNNMAFSPTTNRLYVTQEALGTVYVYDMAHAVAPALAYSCSLGASGKASGSPAVVGSSAANERGLIADSGNSLLWAITNNGSICDTVATKNISVGTGAVGTPTTDNTNIYLPYGGTGVATTTLAALLAGTPAPGLHPLTIIIVGPVDLTSGALFFADAGNYHSYSLDLGTSNWSATTQVNAPPIVYGGLVFGFGNTNDKKLHAFVQSSGATTSPGFTFGTALNNVSAGTIGLVGATPTIYFADDGQNELAAVSYSAGTPTQSWSFKGTGLKTPGNASVAIAALGTEPTMDSSGMLYFGAGTVVYALITDSTGPVTPVGGTNWPRIGFDNCNSGNSSYTNCQ